MALSPELQQAWDLFADNANWSSLHPEDQRRFWDFVILVHRTRARVGRETIVALLKERKVQESIWQTLQADFWAALEVLERYDEVRQA